MTEEKNYTINDKFYQFKDGKITTNLEIRDVRDFFDKVNRTLITNEDDLYTEEMVDSIVRYLHSQDPSKTKDRHYKYLTLERDEIVYSIDSKYLELSNEGIKTNLKVSEVEDFLNQLNEELEEEGIITFPEKAFTKIKEIAAETRANIKPLSKRKEGRYYYHKGLQNDFKN